jgi:hypothetical protein
LSKIVHITVVRGEFVPGLVYHLFKIEGDTFAQTKSPYDYGWRFNQKTGLIDGLKHEYVGAIYVSESGRFHSIYQCQLLVVNVKDTDSQIVEKLTVEVLA